MCDYEVRRGEMPIDKATALTVFDSLVRTLDPDKALHAATLKVRRRMIELFDTVDEGKGQLRHLEAERRLLERQLEAMRAQSEHVSEIVLSAGRLIAEWGER